MFSKMENVKRIWPRFSNACGLVLLLAASASIAQAAIDTPQFAPLPGPYKVGTADYFWVDSERLEPATSDALDQRHLRVQVWYPAVPAKDAQAAAYLPDMAEFTVETRKVFSLANGMLSRSYRDAPLLEGNGLFPVLVYNHGGSRSRFTSSFVTEAMASYGYVVFSIDHTGFNKSTIFPDGYVYENDQLPAPQADPDKSQTENAEAFFDYLGEHVFPLWVGDAEFTLDQIERLNNDGKSRFAGRLDLEHIGTFGWSFGGATAVQLSRDPRIKAALDYDGQLFGDVREKGTDTPVMLLHNSTDPNPENDASMAALVEKVFGWDDALFKASSNDWYEITINGSNHGSFSDLVLYYPVSEDGPSKQDFQRQHSVIIDLTRDFFDKYLRGQGETPLLRGELDNYPELDFQSSALQKSLSDQRVLMRDGVELSMDVHLPRGEGPFPTVLIRTPYVKSAATFTRYKLAAYVQNGYAVAFQDTRGQGLSDGEFNFYFPEGKDGYDTIEWVAEQPWSNGKVAMDGGSYLGTVQWLAAMERPPHLECILPHSPSGRLFNETPYVGGAFAMQWALPWLAGRYPGATLPNTAEEMHALAAHRPLLTMDQVFSGRELPLYRDMLTHSTLDGYWQDIHITSEEFARIDIPALTVAGWFDGDQPGALFYWLGMRANSPAANRQFLVVGPWQHSNVYLNGELEVGEIELAARAVLDMQVVRLGFLDWCLKGEERAFRMPRAMLYLTGADRWLEMDDYPPAGASTLKLFLSSAGQANTSSGDGALNKRPPGRDTPDHYVYDPRNPVKTMSPATDHSAVEEREDVLVYTGPELRQALTVLGTPYVELYASSDALDTDFTAKLLDVYPDGRAIKINWTLGAIRARYRNGYEQEELLKPGEPTRFRIELSAIGHVFQPGHRIRLEISSSDYPYINQNQNTGNPVATDTEWRTANQTIHHSKKMPSRLELPVISNSLWEKAD